MLSECIPVSGIDTLEEATGRSFQSIRFAPSNDIATLRWSRSGEDARCAISQPRKVAAGKAKRVAEHVHGPKLSGQAERTLKEARLLMPL